MKILVLTKRQYMAKDLLDDHFGRFRELPMELARLGNEVSGICLSYRRRDETTIIDGDTAGSGRVTWHSRNLGGAIFPGLIRHFRRADKLVREFRPQLIWACSDSLHAIAGVRLGKLTHTPCVVDLYDNFESFGASRIPGVLPLFKKAVRSADGVTCVSPQLSVHIKNDYRRSRPTFILANGVRPDLFYPRERALCRRQLGLPESANIIGTAGALSRSRGVDALFGAFETLAADDPNLHLATAGPHDRHTRIAKDLRVHHLGVLALERAPILINALDVAVICNRDSLFGRYNFPQKAYEIIACRVPLVAAAVGAMKDLLAGYPECLFEPENGYSCAAAVRRQLKNPTTLDLVVPSWADLA